MGALTPGSLPTIGLDVAELHEAQRQPTADFRYELPSSLIATHPAEPRGASRLLVHVPASPACEQLGRDVVSRARQAAEPDETSRWTGRSPVAAGERFAAGGSVFDLHFGQLPSVLPHYSHLVFNHSRVFAARVFGRRDASHETAGAGSGQMADRCEILFLSPISHADPAAALSETADGQLWRAMVRAPLEQAGETIVVCGRIAGAAERGEPLLRLHVDRVLSPWIEQGEPDGVEAAVRLSLASPADIPPPVSLLQLLTSLGETPLPPYLQRDATPEDVTSYQTVYAADHEAGSVAAPTAGLHFTPEVLATLGRAGVRTSSLALHVGAGTFKPVGASALGGHAMHAEPFSISADALAALARSAAEGRPLVPVGTTSARVLESLYWLSLRNHAIMPSAGADLGHLDQWEAYQIAAAEGRPFETADRLLLSRAAALDRLLARANASGGRLYGSTSLCVAPGYPFALCDGLVTNFHAPDSTLMFLVSALMGGAANAHEVYAHAVESRYRFLSYGDSSLLVRAR